MNRSSIRLVLCSALFAGLLGASLLAHADDNLRRDLDYARRGCTWYGTFCR